MPTYIQFSRPFYIPFKQIVLLPSAAPWIIHGIFHVFQNAGQISDPIT